LGKKVWVSLIYLICVVLNKGGDHGLRFGHLFFREKEGLVLEKFRVQDVHIPGTVLENVFFGSL